MDAATGEVVPVELFVAVLGASNYTYAEATLTQRSVDFIQSHTRTVEYFGGVSVMVVPDQLRTGVTDPCRYEPRVQRTYADWAAGRDLQQDGVPNGNRDRLEREFSKDFACRLDSKAAGDRIRREET
ncbi:MAG: transposase [Acidobacteria bacterium]|nr:transposase [Acidobacteriota bacterium]